ncbi:MAG: hypothetical protein FD141_1377 [Fusobacteria bacterium]|nr:MAG: hypothetical protein FD141_1377 [Fusobacteriota bacterium]KAF0230090.1 MAG: hypothetical protein FD182_480 [Fusobacteriota bacterium]
MFRDEKLLIRLSLFLLIALSTTLYFGQSEVINSWLNFFGLNSAQAILFIENLFVVENEFIPKEANVYLGMIGYMLSLILLFILRTLRKTKGKRVVFTGVTLLTLGFIEMIFLDISVVGWLAGPMMMIAGFLLYKKSRLYF